MPDYDCDNFFIPYPPVVSTLFEKNIQKRYYPTLAMRGMLPEYLFSPKSGMFGSLVTDIMNYYVNGKPVVPFMPSSREITTLYPLYYREYLWNSSCIYPKPV